MKKKTIILALVILIFTFCGCFEKQQNEDIPFYSTDVEVFKIETPKYDLYYPIMWKEQIKIDIVEDDDEYSVIFTASVDYKEIPLFELVFGGNEGTLIGTLENDKPDEVKVYMNSYGFNLDGYTEDQKIDICGMNEDVNVIISKLVEQYDFELVI